MSAHHEQPRPTGRSPLTRAFDAAAGPVVRVCRTCRGLPCPPMVRTMEQSVCAGCGGLVDGAGEPVRRWPVPVGFPTKLIVLVDDEEDAKLDGPSSGCA